MTDGLGTETAGSLLAIAAEHEHELSAWTLARWHRIGLLPAPKLRRLGRGRGSESVYPPGTGKQLIALCRFRAQESRISVVAWLLWWHGYQVRGHWVRGFLDAAVNRFGSELIAPNERYGRTHRLRALARIWLGGTAGPFSGSRNDAVATPTEPVLARLREALRPAALHALLQEVEETELVHAREEVHFFAYVLSAAGLSAEVMSGQVSPGPGSSARSTRDASADDWAMLFLMWLGFRRRREIADGRETIRDRADKQVTQRGADSARVLQLLVEKIPAFRDVLLSREAGLALRTPQLREALHAEVRRVYFEHLLELTELAKRYPEVQRFFEVELSENGG